MDVLFHTFLFIFMWYIFTGQIGVEVSVNWYEPERSTELGINDTVARAFQYSTGLFTEPLFGSGSLPELTDGQGHTVAREYAAHVKG